MEKNLPHGGREGVMRPPPGERLVPFDALTEPGAQGFTYGAGRERYELFVVRWNGAALAYENVCPHARTSLEWQPGGFFNIERTALQCSTHGALFDVLTGGCFHGPCKGKALTRFPVRVDSEGWVVVDG